MIEQRLIEYLANGFWQLPLLAAGGWTLLRIVKPGPAVQHRVWLAVLGLALLLPMRGAADRKVRANVAQERTVAMQQGAAFPPDAFDAVGQPGGLVLGHQTDGAWANLSNLAFASRVRRVQLNGSAVHGIVGLYLATGLIGLIRLVWAWRGARRLVIQSRVIALTGREQEAFSECARRIGVKVPQVRQLHATESRGISGPVVVGAINPVLLWQESFARDLIAREREEELMAAVCHEMAHIRRHDYLINLLCEAASLPLKWHPVTNIVEGRIRATREMVCDDMAAGAMASETKYAECLLSLAQRMVQAGGISDRATGSVAAVGLFSHNVLEERVMRLMQAKTSMSMRAKATRAIAGGAAMTAAFALAAVFHVTPAAAQAEPAPAQSTSTAPSTPQAALTDPASAQTEAGSGAGSPEAAPVLPVPSAAAIAPAPIPPVGFAPVAPIGPVGVGPQVAPAAPAPSVAQPAALAPVAPTPSPVPSVAPDSDRTECKDREMFAFVNGKRRQLTPEEKRKVEQQLAEAQAKIAAATAKLNSPEFRKQMEDAQHQAIEAEQKLNRGEFRKQMEDARRQVAKATAKLNSPEFRKQMADAQQLAADAVNNVEFQKRMADAQQQIAEAKAKLNSPEFRQQLEDAQRKAIEAETQIDSAEFQKQMADAQQQLADALARMKAEQNDTDKK
jgi:beta-lactamase regulating signal transducer with metallopeptidase domain